MMIDWIWDGEMDYGWEDLSDFLIRTCHKYTRIMLKAADISSNTESKGLIQNKSMERFEKIASIVSDIIKDGLYYAYEDFDGEAQNALKLNGWILLGSLTETTLQMFLAIYIEDYKNTKWQMWEKFEAEKVQRPILESIQKLVDENSINSNQAKSLKKSIKETIKEHTKEHKIEKIMLDELIQLYSYLNLLNEDEISYLKTIQSNRNGIHSFQDRKTGSWNNLQYCVRFFCYLLEWVLYTIPDVSGY